MTNLKAIIIARVSSPNQVEGTSLNEQLLACQKKVMDMEGEIVAVYDEAGKSGALFLGRPDIQRSIKDIASGKANALVMYKVDRIGRTIEVIRAIRREVEKAGGELILADGLKVDNTPTGNLIFNQFAAFAEFERDQIKERTQKGRRRMAIERQKQPIRAKCPYGYHIKTKKDDILGLYPDNDPGDYIILPDEAQWTRQIFAWYLEGKSLREISKSLHTVGVKTKADNEYWQTSTIRKMFLNPVYKGEAHAGAWNTERIENPENKNGFTCTNTLRPQEEWITIICPAIVSAREWQEVNDRLKTNQSLLSGWQDKKHLLTGMLICNTCEHKMSGNSKQVKLKSGWVGYYNCSNRGEKNNPNPCSARNHIKMQVVEEAIIHRIKELANDEKFTLENAISSYQQKIVKEYDSIFHQQLNSRLTELDQTEKKYTMSMVEVLAAGGSREVFISKFEEIRREREEITEKLSRLDAIKNNLKEIDQVVKETQEKICSICDLLDDPSVPMLQKNLTLATLINFIAKDEKGFIFELKTATSCFLLTTYDNSISV